MAVPRTIDEASASASKCAAMPVGAGRGRLYRYRGASKSGQPAHGTEKVRRLLQYQRQLISFKSSSFRNLSAQMNELIAQALRDGLKITAVAQATRLSRADVRRIGIAFEDLEPAGTPVQDHLTAIVRMRAEVAAAAEERASIEKKRVQVLALARREGILDDYELASLSGLNPGEIGRMTWGVDSRAPLPA